MAIAPRIEHPNKITKLDEPGYAWSNIITYNQELLSRLEAYLGQEQTTQYDLRDPNGNTWVAELTRQDDGWSLSFLRDGQRYDSLNFETNYRHEGENIVNDSQASELKNFLFSDLGNQIFETRHRLNVQVNKRSNHHYWDFDKSLTRHPVTEAIEQKISELAKECGINQAPVTVLDASYYQILDPTVKGLQLVIDLSGFGQNDPRQSEFIDKLEQLGIIDHEVNEKQHFHPSQRPRGLNAPTNYLDTRNQRLALPQGGKYILTTTPAHQLLAQIQAKPVQLDADVLAQGQLKYSAIGKPPEFSLEIPGNPAQRYVAPASSDLLDIVDNTRYASPAKLAALQWTPVFYSDIGWAKRTGTYLATTIGEKPAPVMDPPPPPAPTDPVPPTADALQQAQSNLDTAFGRIGTLWTYFTDKNSNPSPDPKNRPKGIETHSWNPVTGQAFRIELDKPVTVEGVTYTHVAQDVIAATIDGKARPGQYSLQVGQDKDLKTLPLKNLPAEQALEITNSITGSVNKRHADAVALQEGKLPFAQGAVMGAGALLTAFGLSRESFWGKVVGSLAGLATMVGGAIATANRGAEIRESRGQHVAEADRNLSTIARDFIIGLTSGKQGMAAAT